MVKAGIVATHIRVLPRAHIRSWWSLPALVVSPCESLQKILKYTVRSTASVVPPGALPHVPGRPSRRTIRKRSRRRSPCAVCKGLVCLASRPPAPPRSAPGAAWDAPSAQSAPRFDSVALVSSRATVSELGGRCGALVETGERACGRAGASTSSNLIGRERHPSWVSFTVSSFP